MWYVILAIGGFIGYTIIRAVRYQPLPEEPVTIDEVDVDLSKAVERFQTLLRIPTVSYEEKEKIDPKVFEQFREAIPTLYPHLQANSEMTNHGETGVLFHIKGRSQEQPTVWMAHYDVVPAESSQWSVDPFGAVIQEDRIWARGSLDTKGTLCAILEATEQLLSENFVFENDCYLAFSGDEEIHGESAPAIVSYLEAQKNPPQMVLDEGGAVVKGVFPGVDRPIAVVGIAEKGQCNIRLELSGKGGHASTPPSKGTLYQLAKAIENIEKSPFPYQITAPVHQMFEILGRHSNGINRWVFANRSLLQPLLDRVTRKKGGELNAMVRTTTALTQMSASEAINVLPDRATVGINVRMLPGEDEKSVKEHLERVIQNDAITLKTLYSTGDCPISDATHPNFKKLEQAIRATWEDSLVTPYLMMACSDSRHYARLCPQTYRFSAMDLDQEELRLIHGVDERIRIHTFEKTIAFYLRLMKKM